MTGSLVRAGAALIIVASIVAAVATSPRLAAQGGPGFVVVCAGVDGVLRARMATCAAGETPPPPADSAPSAGTPPEPSLPAPSATAELEGRISELERSRSDVFQVVDGAGRRIFTAAPAAVRVFNRNGAAVASITGSASGGTMTAQSAGGQRMVSVDANGMRIVESGHDRITLGGLGHHSLRVLNSEKMLAGIGLTSDDGTGLIAVNTRDGKLRAQMSVGDGQGRLSVFNAAGEAVATLTEGQSGGGLLAISDATGEPIVKMGVTSKGYGVVLTGPAAGLPFVPKSGLPGSYLLGCAGGPSCVPE